MNAVCRTAAQKGLQLPRPEYLIIECDDITIEMEKLYKRKVQIYMFYIDSKVVKSHSTLKLNEKRFCNNAACSGVLCAASSGSSAPL